MASSFDAAAWLASRPASSCGPVHVSQPAIIAVWTKDSADAVGGRSEGGGNSASSGGVRFGDVSGLLPFQPPCLPANLDTGVQRYVAKPSDENVGVETVVQAVASAAVPGVGDALGGSTRMSVPLDSISIVTFRNNLNKILGTPFSPGSPWTVYACLLPTPSSSSSSGDPASGSGGGVLFLDIVRLEEPWVGPDNERFMRWGYTFEALCTGQAVADATSEFGVLLRGRLGRHRLFMGAEVDCYDPSRWQPPAAPGAAVASGGGGGGAAVQPGPAAAAAQQGELPPLEALLELKTYKLPQHAGQQRSVHRWKHPKWWLQSFLAGVPRLALGARDDQGTLLRVDLIDTAALPCVSAQNGAAWSPNQALAFGDAALAWMRQQAEAHPGQQLRFAYQPGRDGRSAGAVACAAVPGGALPERLRRCLRECGLQVGE